MTDYIGNYKNRPRRVVFYGRVSTEHEEQLSALGNQMEWYTDLALRNPNWTVVAQYIDEGITGTQMKKRPSFMRMIEHAKEHRFDLIVTRELSRFARNTVDALNATRELKQYGVEVYFVNDGIWTMDGDGEVRLTIMASIAQDESRKTSERVKAGQKMSREKGVLYGSGNIIGYDRVDGTYVINKEQAETVRRIFNLYAEGHGETTVAKMLIEENRKDGGGGLSWTASKVSRVLRKPTYKGYMTYNKSHIDDFLSHNRINHSEEDFVLVKGDFEPIVSEELWETCNQIRSKRAAFVKGKDGRAHKFGVSFPQNKWTKILFCDCGMRFQIEGYDKTANGGKNMRLICARSKMFKKKDAVRALNGVPCPAPYASEWKLELMAREVFRTVWKENAEDILGLLRMLDANLNTTGTPNDGNQLENKLSALNEELDDLVSQRASRSITMDDFLSRSTEINNEIINVEGLLQSSIQEQRPKARLDMHSIEAALSDDASFPDGKIEPGFLDRYANRIVKSNNRYIWMLQLMNVQQIMPIQSERQPIAMVTYKSGVSYDIEQEQIGKQDKESAGPDCATICRPQDFFLNMGRTKRKRKLVEWLESCQENQVSVLDEKIPLLSFAVDFVTAYEYQKARGIKIHPGLWKDMRVDIFLVKKEN
jgi:DNA invertase Pin-like site-specific DNA recombinase